jgi:hypothetical protein
MAGSTPMRAKSLGINNKGVVLTFCIGSIAGGRPWSLLVFFAYLGDGRDDNMWI